MRIRTPALMLALLLALACTPGCESEIVPFLAERFVFVNASTTDGGLTNTHRIVRVQLATGFSHSADIAPGDSAEFEVVFPGDYTLSVTYDDQTSEARQDPPDPVHVDQAQKETVTFYHQD